jgi:hypothetical protein
LKFTVTPAGAPLEVSVTAELNPFSVVVVTVEVPIVPCAALTSVPLMVKSGGGVTVRLTVVVCIVPPLVPVMVIVYVPVAVLESTVNVAVEVPLPGAAIDAGLKPTVTPAGAPLAERLTAALNPFNAVVVTVEVPELPWPTLTGEEAEMLKSAGGVTVRFTVAVCVIPPPMPVMVIG